MEQIRRETGFVKRANAAIAIPVYKEVPTPEELLSFKQCLSVFGDRQIFLCCSTSLNLQKYFQEVPDSAKVMQQHFNEFYFLNVRNYNKLLLSEHFYQTFESFEYLLVYQLDAYVFDDQLDYWCSKGFDYIGAPWFEDYHLNTNYNFSGVGNGGFSLRKISAISVVLANWEKYLTIKTLLKSRFLVLATKVKLIFFHLNFPSPKNQIPLNQIVVENEDYMLGLVFGQELKVLSIPDCVEASRFAFEVHAEYLYKENDFSLPFGCHAWYKYDVTFWKTIIDGQLKLSKNQCS